MGHAVNSMQSAVDSAWVSTIIRGDREFASMARRWAGAVSRIPKRQMEQVEWVIGLNKFYDRVVNPFGGESSSPSMQAIASGRAAKAMLEHIEDIARWMDFRERHGGSGDKMTYEQSLDRIDRIAEWCGRNGVGRVAMKAREFVAACKDRISVMNKVQEVVK